MTKQRILVIAPPEVNARLQKASLPAEGCELFTAADPVSGVAEAVAKIPDVVVVAGGDNATQSLRICNQILQYLPEERQPTFVISNPRHDLLSLLGTQTAEQSQAPPPNSAGVRDAQTWHDDGLPHQIECHGLTLDRAKVAATIHGQDIVLTVTEFSVLWTLASRPGHVKTRRQLMEACRGQACVVGRRTVDQHVRSIRRKLGPHADIIETVRGVGYRFREAPVPASGRDKQLDGSDG